MARKSVVIVTAEGVEYGVRSASVAEKHYPDAVIVRHQDGTPYRGKQPKRRNRGQNEQMHTFVSEDGTTTIETMAWWKSVGKAAGWVKAEDVDDDPDAVVSTSDEIDNTTDVISDPGVVDGIVEQARQDQEVVDVPDETPGGETNIQ